MSTPGVDAPPLPQPARAVELPAWHEQTLRSGVRLVVVPRRRVPLVTALLLVRAGPELDAPGHPGVAGMAATLLTKGAIRNGIKQGAATIARQAEALGASLDSGSGWGATTLSMTVTPSRLDAALDLMADALRRPLLADAELERVRAQSLDSMRVTLASPGEVARLALRRAFWGDTAYGQLTPPAALRRITRGEVMSFHARQLRPERTALVLSGDIDAEQAARLAHAHFGVWLPAAPAVAAPAAQAPAAMNERLLLIDMPGSGQSGVTLAAPFVAQGAADRRIGLVANAVLGGGYSARLNQEVRIRRGLSYGAASDTESLPSGGMLVARTQTQHATAAQVLQLMRAEVLQLAEQPPAAEELAARQAALVGGFARRLDTTAGLAVLVMGQIAQSRPLADLNRYVSDILAVTPEQVRDFARQHWQPEHLRAVVAGDLKAAGPALQALDAKALRLNLADLDLEQLGRRPAS